MLYANTDFSKLSWLETQWASWYLWIDNPIIATGLMSFLMHEVSLMIVEYQNFHQQKLNCTIVFQVVYFGRCIPWILIDAIPYFRKWKLQPTKIPTAKEQWDCTKQVLFSHFTIELPAVSLPPGIQ